VKMLKGGLGSNINKLVKENMKFNSITRMKIKIEQWRLV